MTSAVTRFAPPLALALGLAAPATSTASDELWTFGGIEGRWSPRLEWSAGQHLRFDEGRASSWMPEGKIAYEIWRGIELGLGARYMRERDNAGDWQDRSLYFADLAVGGRLSEQWRVRYRLRWQEEHRDREDDGTPIRQVLRHRVSVDYRLNGDVTPFAAIELFDRLDRRDDFRFDRIRYTLGAEFDIGKHKSLSAYLREIVPADKAEEHSTVVGFEFKFSLR